MTGVLEPRVTVLTTASLALFQITLTPYASESGDLCQKPKEYYNKNAQLCCAACPPGERQIEAGCLDGGAVGGVLVQAWGRGPSVLTGLLLGAYVNHLALGFYIMMSLLLSTLLHVSSWIIHVPTF